MWLTIIFTIIGARTLYVLVNIKDFVADPIGIFKVWEGGLVFFGGLIGAVTADLIWMKRKKLPVFKITDICAPFIALGHAIGRLGCYFNGCCYGSENHKYGVVFPAVGDNLPHLPVQIYESGLNFLNAIFLLLFLKYFKKNDGEVFALYFFIYGIIRFFMEMLRGDATRGFVFGMSTSSFISVFIITIGAVGFVRARFFTTAHQNKK